MQKTFKISSLKPITRIQIWHMILDINIQAIQKLIEGGDLNQWELLLENHNSSLEEVQKLAKKRLDFYMAVRKDPVIPISSLIKMDTKWFNTLRSTLFMLEEELILRTGSLAVWEMWDIFFKIEEARKFNYMTPLQIESLYKSQMTQVRLKK